jgi:hypothetical protein
MGLFIFQNRCAFSFDKVNSVQVNLHLYNPFPFPYYKLMVGLGLNFFTALSDGRATNCFPYNVKSLFDESICTVNIMAFLGISK